MTDEKWSNPIKAGRMSTESVLTEAFQQMSCNKFTMEETVITAVPSHIGLEVRECDDTTVLPY